MRLYQLGILLIILSVLIPIIIIAIGAALTASTATTGTAYSQPNVGGAIVIFPLIPIPILITFGKPTITQPLLWLTYVIFLIFIALIIFSVIQYVRARREAIKRWQEEHK